MALIDRSSLFGFLKVVCRMLNLEILSMLSEVQRFLMAKIKMYNNLGIISQCNYTDYFVIKPKLEHFLSVYVYIQLLNKLLFFKLYL